MIICAIFLNVTLYLEQTDTHSKEQNMKTYTLPNTVDLVHLMKYLSLIILD